MSTKALFPCGGGSNLILATGTENQIWMECSDLHLKRGIANLARCMI